MMSKPSTDQGVGGMCSARVLSMELMAQLSSSNPTPQPPDPAGVPIRYMSTLTSSKHPVVCWCPCSLQQL
jgi:hypothetical protein